MNDSDDPKPVRVEDIGGDELTRRVRYHWAPEDELTAFDRRFGDNFWNDLKDKLAECDRVMAMNGWERTAEKPKNWPLFDGDCDPYSDLWYAGQVGVECWTLLGDRDRLERQGLSWPEVHLSRIMRIGWLWSEWWWRRTYKPSILTGAKQRATLAIQWKKREAKATAAVKRRRAAIAELLPSTSATKGARERLIRRQLGKRGIVASARTIRSDLAAMKPPINSPKKVGKPR